MNIIQKGIIVWVVGVIISSITAFILLKFQIVMWFLILIFIIGYFIGELMKLIRIKKIKFDINDKVMLTLCIISILCAIIIPYSEPSIKEQFDRLYFPKDSVNFNTEFIKPINSSSTSPKFIFAFDNSGEGLCDTISENLKDKYTMYCSDIRAFCGEKLSEKEKRKLNKVKCITYGELLKARLCFDLSKKNTYKGSFRVIK
jgi:hypothetical protein